MKAETLKKSILQYAMQGKLVEQNPDDEPASELLKRIKAEKEQLIKDGKIKNEKPLPPITEEKIQYELPQGWEVTRLNQIYNFIDYRGKTPNKLNDGIPLITAKNVKKGYNDYKIAEFISESEFQTRQSRGISKKGDVLFTTEAPMGNVSIADLDVYSTGQRLICLQQFKNILDNKFVMYYLLSEQFQNILNNKQTGTTVTGIKAERLKQLPIIIPPLAEQQRIVEKLEQILPLVEEYGKNEEKLSELNKTLPDKIKQSILQHAVQGKLVPQNPTDEPASELLKRIKAEKEQLIKDGKIKKEKPLAPIADDEIPYELPQGWRWVRLRDLTEIITKGSSPSWQDVNYTDKKEVLFITSENVGRFKLLLNKIKYVEFKFNKIEPRSILEYNDILMNIVGASIGRSAIFQLEDVVANINQATCIIRLMKTIKIKPLLDYLLLFFNSSVCHSYMYNSQVDSARANLSMTNIANFLIPLPPLAEQQRIVDKVEELMKIVDKLEH